MQQESVFSARQTEEVKRMIECALLGFRVSIARELSLLSQPAPAQPSQPAAKSEEPQPMQETKQPAPISAPASAPAPQLVPESAKPAPAPVEAPVTQPQPEVQPQTQTVELPKSLATPEKKLEKVEKKSPAPSVATVKSKQKCSPVNKKSLPRWNAGKHASARKPVPQQMSSKVKAKTLIKSQMFHAKKSAVHVQQHEKAEVEKVKEVPAVAKESEKKKDVTPMKEIIVVDPSPVHAQNLITEAEKLVTSSIKAAQITMPAGKENAVTAARKESPKRWGKQAAAKRSGPLGKAASPAKANKRVMLQSAQ